MEKEKMLYNSLRERVKIEYKLYVLAFIFILIADSIGRISIPMKIGYTISNFLFINFRDVKWTRVF